MADSPFTLIGEEPAQVIDRVLEQAQRSKRRAWIALAVAPLAIAGLVGFIAFWLKQPGSSWDWVLFFVVLPLSMMPLGLATAFGLTARRYRKVAAAAASCQEMGFTFLDKAQGSQLADFAKVPLFQLGHSRSANNVMLGSVGTCPVALLDYTYSTGSGKNRQTHTQTVVVVPTATPLPNFQLYPENWFHRLGQLLGRQDINFEEDAAFSRAYQLRGSQEEQLRAVFTPEIRAMLLSRPGWSVESTDGLLAVYRGNTCNAGQHGERVAEVCTIRSWFDAGHG